MKVLSLLTSCAVSCVVSCTLIFSAPSSAYGYDVYDKTFNSKISKVDIAKDKQQIITIIKQFDKAIVKQNKADFLKLFYDGSVSWISVISQVSLGLREQQMKSQSKEQQTSVKRAIHSSPEKYIDAIIAANSKFKKTFENVKITTDGNIASVYFEYAFFSGYYKNNWGEESWQLVKTDDGWKINSVAFSMTMNPEVRKIPK